jgi:integrase
MFAHVALFSVMSGQSPYNSSHPTPWQAQPSEQKIARGNRKIAHELHTSSAKAKRVLSKAKTSASYWMDKVRKPGSSPHFNVQIHYRGERHRFPLETGDKSAAAEKARDRFLFLIANGWPATLEHFKPAASPKIEASTIGGLIREIEAVAGFKAITFATYTRCLRQIAAGIGEIGDQPERDEQGHPIKDRRGRIKYMSRRHGEGNKAWIAAVDALPLDSLSTTSVQKWKVAYIKAAGEAPDARRSAETTAASILRNARALFSEKALQHARSNLVLPNPLPFNGVRLPAKAKSRYQSRIDAQKLIEAARADLAGEPFKIFVLGLLCGLRKREIDLLTWAQVDFSKSLIRIEETKWFSPKSQESVGEVDLDPELLLLLQGWKSQAQGSFVIESAGSLKSSSKRTTYRCEPAFEILYRWLRKQGVQARKPLHELRKELGAILASMKGIYAAQSVLRHAQISTTAAYYADKKTRITAGLGSLLQES